jgi:diguanylate cyclase (GGDEF)-like protein
MQTGSPETPGLIDSIARATSVRDRDEFDRATAELVFDYVHPRCVKVYRLVGDETDRRVQMTVLIDALGAQEMPPVESFEAAPTVGSQPHWNECVLLSDIVHYVPEDHDSSRRPTMRLNTVFPIEGERGVVGLIEVEFAGRRSALRPAEAQVLRSALGILRNHLNALDYGERDTLTGLLNRRTFESAFAKRRNAQVHARRGGSNRNWLAVADIDKFKLINDNYGHLFGDEVLLLVARKITATFRSSEQIFRFGGEEFVVILDCHDEEGATRAFERMRMNIGCDPFPQIGNVTVSIGFTEMASTDVPASTIERADAALYYAKNNGRNRSLCYEALVREGRIDSRQRVEHTEIEIF